MHLGDEQGRTWNGQDQEAKEQDDDKKEIVDVWFQRHAVAAPGEGSQRFSCLPT